MLHYHAPQTPQSPESPKKPGGEPELDWNPADDKNLGQTS